MQGRTTALGPLLRSAGLREFDALGSVGRPVVDSAPQLRATIRRQLGEDIAAMLAVPQSNESGDAVDWYAPSGGLVVPWSAATPEEREDMRVRLQAARELVVAHGEALTAQLRDRPAGATADDFEVYARLLPHVMRIPDDSHIYAVDGKPVLTFWGFSSPRQPEVDVIRDLMPPSAAPVLPAAVMPVAVPRRGWNWRWLLWLLPLLLLLALLLGLRACDSPFLPQGLRPLIPDLAVPDIAVPGAVVPGAAVGVDGGAVAPSSPDNAATLPQADDKSSSPDKSPTPPTPDDKSVPDKGKPLVIPSEAKASGDTAFLDGKWTAKSGLMDGRTGLPVAVEHDFKDGKGKTTIRRGDGTVCVGNSTATMQGGKLVITGDDDPACNDGSRYARSRIECTQGKDGKAVCSGKQPSGQAYSVDMGR